MLARGPNTLNLTNYTQGEAQHPVYLPQQQPSQSQPSIEQRFDTYIRDLNRNEQILAKISSNLEQLSHQDGLSFLEFYPQFVFETNYVDDQEKLIVKRNDPELARILDGLESGNGRVKGEWKGWVGEFAKKARFTEILVTENQVLRKYIATKNKDIIKLLQSIQTTQNTELTTLTETLSQLKQQNGILLNHLSTLQSSQTAQKNTLTKLSSSHHSSQLKRLELQSRISKCDDEQEHYAKMVVLLEQSIREAREREKVLEGERGRLEARLAEYRGDQEGIQREIGECEGVRRDIDGVLRPKYNAHAAEKEELIQKIEEFYEKIQEVKEQTKKTEQGIERLQIKTLQFTKLNDQLLKKIQLQQKQISRLQQIAQNITKDQVEQLVQINMLQFDIQLTKQQLNQLEQKQSQLKQHHRTQQQQHQKQLSQQLKKYQQQFNEKRRASELELEQQKSLISIKKREIEDWQARIREKMGEVKELKGQIQEIKENQRVVAEMRRKGREVGGQRGQRGQRQGQGQGGQSGFR